MDSKELYKKKRLEPYAKEIASDVGKILDDVLNETTPKGRGVEVCLDKEKTRKVAFAYLALLQKKGYFKINNSDSGNCYILSNIKVLELNKYYYDIGFDEFLNDYPSSKIKLIARKVEFNPIKQKIKFEDKISILPLYQNESDLCKVMFDCKINKPIEWSIIYEEIAGEESDNPKKDSKSIRDTVKRLNDRICGDFNTKDKLFSWKDKCVIRNF